jgi:hypothetical protein
MREQKTPSQYAAKVAVGPVVIGLERCFSSDLALFARSRFGTMGPLIPPLDAANAFSLFSRQTRSSLMRRIRMRVFSSGHKTRPEHHGR